MLFRDSGVLLDKANRVSINLYIDLYISYSVKRWRFQVYYAWKINSQIFWAQEFFKLQIYHLTMKLILGNSTQLVLDQTITNDS